MRAADVKWTGLSVNPDIATCAPARMESFDVYVRFSISLASRIVSALGQTLLLVALARGLGVQAMGAWGTAFATSLAVLNLLDFGMTTRVLRLGNDPDGPNYLGLLALTRTILAVALPLAAFGVALAIEPIYAMLAAGAAAFAIGESNADAAVAIWQGRLQSGHVAAATLVRRTATLVPLIGGINTTTLFLVMLANAAIGSGALVLSLRRSVGAPMGYLKAANRNLPFALALAGPQIGQLDSLVVNSTLGISTAGFYSLAVRLNSPLSIAVATLVQVLVPELTRSPSDRTRLDVFKRIRRLVTVIAIAIAALAPLAPWATTLVFGAEYEAAGPIVAAVVVGAGFSAVSQVHLAWFYGTRTPLALSFAILGCALTGLGVIAVSGALGGIFGLALAYLAAQVLVSAVIIAHWSRATKVLRGACG